MAKLKLNLLPKKGAREILALKVFDRVKRGSFVLLGAYICVLLLIFGWRFMLGNQIKRLNREVAYKSAQIENNRVLEGQQMLVKQRLRLTTQVSEEQKSWSQLLGEIKDFLPYLGAVESVVLKDDGEFEVTVSTNRLQELVVMVKSLRQIGRQKDFIENVYLNSLEKTVDGYYGFVLVFET